MSGSSNHDYDADLEKYFTNAEKPRRIMETMARASLLSKRMLIIHGVGGIGKSTLLRILRLYCKAHDIPMALASGDEEKSPLDILTRWSNDLKTSKVELKSFYRSLDECAVIRGKVEGEVSKLKSSGHKNLEYAGKVAPKTVEGIFDLIPGIGPFLGSLGAIGTESVIDWLQGFLTKSQIDFLLDPGKKLFDEFIADIDRAASKRRLVIAIDTFEQLLLLENWTRELAQRLNSNVLLIIAGRTLPSWDRQWPGWMTKAEIQELKPMSEKAIAKLIRRYYAHVRGGKPDAKQVEAIIHFAKGLPLVVTSAVRLWVKYGVDDFQSIKPEVVSDLVDRLMENVPADVVSVLEVASCLRWFNKELLSAVTGLEKEKIDAMYPELRRFPFVRPRVEGLSLHEVVRDLINENIRLHDPQRYVNIHKEAAAHYEDKFDKFLDMQAFGSALELLYHSVCVDEITGIGLFQLMAEKITQYRLVDPLSSLLQDVNSYPLASRNGHLWLQYYQARLAHLEERLTKAETAYESILNDGEADDKLRAYSLSDWGEIQSRYERLGTTGNLELVTHRIKTSLMHKPLDTHLCNGYFHLARIARYQGLWDEENNYLRQARNYFEKSNEHYGLSYTCSEMKRTNGRRGLWKEFLEAHEEGIKVLSRMPSPPAALRATLFGKWLWAWALLGRVSDCERYARASLDITRKLKFDVLTLEVMRNLAHVLGLQQRFSEAEKCFDESLSIIRKLGSDQIRHQAVSIGVKGLYLGRKGKLDEAKSHLEESFEIRKSINDSLGMIEALNWLGLVSELRGELDSALNYYNQYTNWIWSGNHYIELDSIVGIIRIKYAQRDYSSIPPLMEEAISMALKYEYKDHLASLYLIKGHLAWENQLSTEGCGFDPALDWYQHALISAMRYNRFLLDQIISGDNVCTPLQPLISYCSTRDKEGQRMLKTLRDWWESDKSGLSCSGAIAVAQDGLSLREMEKLARRQEPGNGRPQQSISTAITLALRSS